MPKKTTNKSVSARRPHRVVVTLSARERAVLVRLAKMQARSQSDAIRCALYETLRAAMRRSRNLDSASRLL